MHIALIVPASGGPMLTSYADHLAPALRSHGHRVEVGDTLDGVSVGATPVIDALLLPRFAARVGELRARGAAALVHHPGAHVVYDGGTPGAERAVLSALDRVISTSTAVAARLAADYALPPERIHVVEPGQDDLPRSPATGPGAVLSTGVLAPRKGYFALIAALERLTDLDWTLTIAGDSRRDPVHAAELRARASERITVLPDPSADALEALWQAADLFALATRWEGYASATAEALRRGLPVATTDGGGAGALVPPEAGAVCPVGDGDTLSKSLRRIIYDRGLRAGMADAAWATGQALPGWPAQAERFAAALAV